MSPRGVEEGGGPGLRAFLAVLVAVATLAHLPVGTSQTTHPEGFKSCGDEENLVLVFLNPDLWPRVDEDGLIHATGRFFIQFQARGPKAMEIDRLYFSFGKPVPGTPAVCDTPEWYTEGAYIKNYRADFDWRDGFFVPINTYNVVDGAYIAALSAYDASGKELVRYWANAVVENGCSMQPCETAENAKNDYIVPWPMILPGDGVRTDGKSGLYVEVAEPVREIKAWLGTHEGQKLLELTNATPPVRDDDAVPDAPPPAGQPNTLTCPEILPTATPQCAKRWGPAWEWDGVVGDEAVIRVRIVDANGNVAEKVVHVGDPTIGGRVHAGSPDLQFEIPEPRRTTDAEGRAVWNVTYKSMNDDGVHGDVFVRNPDGTAVGPPFTARVQPNHVMMGGHEQRSGTVTIVAGPDAAPGSYEFQLVVNYLAAESRVEKAATLHLTVADRAAGDAAAQEEVASKSGEQVESTRGEDLTRANTTVVYPEEVAKDTPAAGVLAALAAVLVAARRRHR